MEVILGRSVNYAGVILRSSGFGSFINSSNLRCLRTYGLRKCNIVLYENKSQDNSLFTYNNFPQYNASNFSKNGQNKSLSSFNEILNRKFSSKTSQDKNPKDDNNSVTAQKPNIFQKMKQLMRDYWHILIPVHVATSIIWVTIFYVVAKNGVDYINLMEFIHIPNQYIEMIRKSNAGHWAVTYALYKLFTPLRYTVTVGGTTMSIRYLDRKGLLKFKRRPTEATPSSKPGTTIKEKTNKNNSKNLEQQ